MWCLQAKAGKKDDPKCHYGGNPGKSWMGWETKRNKPYVFTTYCQIYLQHLQYVNIYYIIHIIMLYLYTINAINSLHNVNYNYIFHNKYM